VAKIKDLEMQQAWRDWIASDLKYWPKPFAVTLTFKKSIVAEGDIYRSRIYINQDSASKNVSLLKNRLTKEVYGNAGWRFDNKLNIFSVFEGGTDTKRLHYHGIIDCPKRKLVNMFPEMIKEAWLKTTWGDVQMCIKSDADKGWANYITKLRDKAVFGDAMDLRNISMARTNENIELR